MDYVNRMSKSSIKKEFIKKNWVDIIAMLPDVLFTSIFGLTGLSGVSIVIRLFRLIRVVRVLALFRKNINIFTKFIQETHLDSLLTAVVIIVIIASLVFYFVNNSMNNFVDSFWYVLVTLITVGYGDIVPTTTGGKVIGIMLIIVGLIVFGTLTGVISSIYTRRIEKESRKELEEKLNRIEKKN
ncbi:Voltage-gated potassium channel [Candidatus Methanobinarius endosymbioticus]|uniref:Voltage-gated potassium channel n=1 Tax=Candidatus Methanobinarius endosymbioticus TaxID=2006182 RepID=A0A366MDI0_9EURY|nr:Voltage-gated potassium channel [Candidatus Methanobinarius endosymbioticus]